MKYSNGMINIMNCNRWHECRTCKKICTNLFMTASKSWTQIATKLKSIPNMYSQKFCALIFLEGFFLMITWIVQNKGIYYIPKKIINISYQMYFRKKTKNTNDEKSRSIESQTSVYTPAKPLKRAITCKKGKRAFC